MHCNSRGERGSATSPSPRGARGDRGSPCVGVGDARRRVATAAALVCGILRFMRAIVLDAPGPPEALSVREVPTPVPQPGEVLLRVKAFGLNRSELTFSICDPGLPGARSKRQFVSSPLLSARLKPLR